MKSLRRKFNQFCYQNRNKGIPNLMLYISIGTAIVYVLSQMDKSSTLYNALCFDRDLILQGQVWRLFTYVFTFNAGNILFMLVSLLCYFSLGRAMENIWGTFRFNLFYFTGVVMMDIFCMLFGGFRADVYYLNMSLFLGYATLYPNAGFLLFYIIPVKAWIFALLDLVIVLSGLFSYAFPYNLFPLIALANYFLFFGKEVLNVIPLSWRANGRRLFRKGKASTASHQKQPKVIPFNAGFLLFFIIPVKAWIFALFDLIITFSDVVRLTVAGLFPYNLFPLIAIANYFLFFGKDVVNVIPLSWRINAGRLFKKKPGTKKTGTVPFPTAGSYQATTAKAQAPYTHKCTVCGRTDATNPELEFRYCSRCNGYHCYCEEHISNHTHIE